MNEAKCQSKNKIHETTRRDQSRENFWTQFLHPNQTHHSFRNVISHQVWQDKDGQNESVRTNAEHSHPLGVGEMDQFSGTTSETSSSQNQVYDNQTLEKNQKRELRIRK